MESLAGELLVAKSAQASSGFGLKGPKLWEGSESAAEAGSASEVEESEVEVA